MTVVGVSAVHELTGYALAIVGIGLFGFLFSYWVLVHGPLRGSRLSRVTRDLTERLGAGMNALTSPREALAVTATTLAAALTAVAVAWLAAGAVGVTLTPAQAVLFLSGIVLALAIPAAPGALGTYEFIGVAILTAYGFEPGQALASVVLLKSSPCCQLSLWGWCRHGCCICVRRSRLPRLSAALYPPLVSTASKRDQPGDS